MRNETEYMLHRYVSSYGFLISKTAKSATALHKVATNGCLRDTFRQGHTAVKGDLTGDAYTGVKGLLMGTLRKGGLKASDSRRILSTAK